MSAGDLLLDLGQQGGYAYVSNNPFRFVDLTGLSGCEKSTYATVSAVIHTVLDIGGMVPAAGVVPDAINTLYYGVEYALGRAELSDVLLSAASTIPVAGLAVGGAKLAHKAAKAAKYGDEVVEAGKKIKNVFPENPNDLTKILGVNPRKTLTKDGTEKMVWNPNANTRIRYESHPGNVTQGISSYNPRHHGNHYHVETKADGISWSRAKKEGSLNKVKPNDYFLGMGTGFLPGEYFP